MLYSLFEFLLADVRLASCEASPPPMATLQK